MCKSYPAKVSQSLQEKNCFEFKHGDLQRFEKPQKFVEPTPTQVRGELFEQFDRERTQIGPCRLHQLEKAPAAALDVEVVVERRRNGLSEGEKDYLTCLSWP